MRKDSLVIALDARPETILARINDSGGHISERPLLAGAGDPLARIQELKAERDEIYRDADLFIETDELTPDAITHEILTAYRERTALAGTAP
jgi:shikimate kinase